MTLTVAADLGLASLKHAVKSLSFLHVLRYCTIGTCPNWLTAKGPACQASMLGRRLNLSYCAHSTHIHTLDDQILCPLVFGAFITCSMQSFLLAPILSDAGYQSASRSHKRRAVEIKRAADWRIRLAGKDGGACRRTRVGAVACLCRAWMSSVRLGQAHGRLGGSTGRRPMSASGASETRRPWIRR